MSTGRLVTEFEESGGLITMDENEIEIEICYIVLPFTVLLLLPLHLFLLMCQLHVSGWPISDFRSYR
jgi:hypothetical protein